MSTARRMARVVALLAGLATLLATLFSIAGCSTKHPRFSGNLTEIIDPISSFSATTLQDWKDVGDAVVAVEITGDRPDPGTAKEPPGANGVYGRLVDLQVLQVYWQRRADVAPPSQFTTKAWGWIPRGNSKQPIVARGEPRLEKDHTYLLVLGKFADGWAGLGSGAEVPFDDGTVGVGEWDGRDKNIEQPAIEQLLGDNAAQVQTALDQTQPDPQAARYDDLDPEQRAKKLGIGK